MLNNFFCCLKVKLNNFRINQICEKNEWDIAGLKMLKYKLKLRDVSDKKKTNFCIITTHTKNK